MSGNAGTSDRAAAGTGRKAKKNISNSDEYSLLVCRKFTRQGASSLGLSEGVRRQSTTVEKETKKKHFPCFNHDHTLNE